MIQRKNLLLILLLLIGISSCQKKQWIVTQYTSTKIAIDSAIPTNSDYNAVVEIYKEKMNAEMNAVIGQAEQTMQVYRPESPLSNLCADIFRSTASSHLKENVDIAIVNMGGLRTELPGGNITVGKIFEVLPFENKLYILWLKGDKLAELFEIFAVVGGEGVSGIEMGIKDGKALNPIVGGFPVDHERVYTVATNDFLAGGNDKLLPLAEYEKFEDTGLMIRDIVINHIKNETANNKKINAQSDGRIYILK